MLLYIHIPFCKKKCTYCSFISFAGRETEAEAYLDLIQKEAEKRKKEFKEAVQTVFIGGGTPSLLSPEQITRLMASLRETLPLKDVAEFTVEANPGTVTESWIRAAKEAGVNRLSFGMQAFQPDLLSLLGRIHSYSDVCTSVALAREYGIRNINIDLIFGIPGQDLRQWQETLEKALALAPVHLSVYGLIPEPDTPLYTDLEKGKYALPDPDLERTMYDLALSMLRDKGFHQYEVSNFALDGYECRHNIGYWKQIPYVGLGLSAASMEILRTGMGGMLCRRKKNPDSFSSYRDSVIGPAGPEEEELVSPQDARFETLMLGLRMNEGVSEHDFLALHGVSLEKAYGKKLRELESMRLLEHSDHRWKLTRRGFDVQNSVLVELMDPP